MQTMKRILLILTLIVAAGGCDSLSKPKDLPTTTYRNIDFNLSMNKPKDWVVIDSMSHHGKFAAMRKLFPYYKPVCAIAISLDSRKGPKVVVLDTMSRATKSATFEEDIMKLVPAELVGGKDQLVTWGDLRFYLASRGSQEVYSYHTDDLKYHVQIFGSKREIALYRPTLEKMVRSLRY